MPSAGGQRGVPSDRALSLQSARVSGVSSAVVLDVLPLGPAPARFHGAPTRTSLRPLRQAFMRQSGGGCNRHMCSRPSELGARLSVLGRC